MEKQVFEKGIVVCKKRRLEIFTTWNQGCQINISINAQTVLKRGQKKAKPIV